MIRLPSAYFPPISYFSYLIKGNILIETKEHFVKQTIRNRCTILGANGALNLLLPRTKPSQRQPFDQDVVHEEMDWRKLHWRSLDSAYRSSPFFEYYEDELQPFFNLTEDNILALNLKSIQLVCSILEIPFKHEITTEYKSEFNGLDLREAWNKIPYREQNIVENYPSYIQVFADRHPFVQDLSILDLLFCVGPKAIDYLQNLHLSHPIR